MLDQQQEVYAHFTNGFSEQARQTYGWLRYYHYSPEIVSCKGRANLPYEGVGASDVTLPADQIEGARQVMRANAHG